MLENLNQKIINNAISAYLMLFISWMLLLNKTNKNINNSFVRSHTNIYNNTFNDYIKYNSF